ncbi:ankyrin repeat protein [Thraustotheca clavata]|uniref:Ankyrin repeat protein n=1 Tax=Thraustotheca clavata TaxID=74557 RepID=A0A1W0A5Q2_9STRA|nr:ankyrin repeat protein [Thraustotheca clavata]
MEAKLNEQDEQGRADVTAVLLQAKADFNISANVRSHFNFKLNLVFSMARHHLIIALQKDYFDIAPLLSVEADKTPDETFDAVKTGDENKLSSLLQGFNDPNIIDTSNETPLMLSIKLCNRQFANIIYGAFSKPPEQQIDLGQLEIYIRNVYELYHINKLCICHSPYVLELLGVSTHNFNETKLILTFMDGGDLRSYLDKKLNDEATLSNYTSLEIAWVIHHNSCIHWDLKSQNVLLSTTHYIKIADMGLTCDIATPMTVLADDDRYGFPLDIYPFGVILTELDTFSKPYCNLPNLSPLTILTRVRDGSLRLSWSPNCAAWYKTLVEKCLQTKDLWRWKLFKPYKVKSETMKEHHKLKIQQIHSSLQLQYEVSPPQNHLVHVNADKKDHCDNVKCADINRKNNDGSTPLHIAVLNGHYNIVQLLITKGAEINAVDKDEMTPLHYAAWCNESEIVTLLLSFVAKINATDNAGRSPLHLAIEENNTNIASQLIEKGANIKESDQDGNTPLHLAARSNCIEIVKLLISKEVDINQTNNLGRSSLHLAAEMNYEDIATVLISEGANINQTDNEGRTALHIALEEGHNEVASYLICKKADIHQADKDSKTPLLIAAEQCNEIAVELLISKGANVNQADESETINGHKAIILMLLQANADLSKTDAAGDTPLMVALDDDEGSTPLHLATYYGLNDIVSLLILKGANIIKLTIDIVSLLLSFGANINATDKRGQSPLHLAIEEDNKNIVSMLEEESNIHEKDKVNSHSLMLMEIVQLKTMKSALEEAPMELCLSPYLLRLLGVCKQNLNEPDLVLTFMGGGDLRSYLYKKLNNKATITNYTSMERAWVIANSLADIHRNLKIQNALLSTKHYTKIADMGLTRDIATMMTAS